MISKQNIILLYTLVVFATQLLAQPYVDPLQVRYTYGFRNASAIATPFAHLWAGSDIPIKLKGSAYLVLSPYYERWQIDSADRREILPVVQSVTFPVGLIMPFRNPKWSMTMLAIARTNGETLFEDNTFQFGGIGFVSYARRPTMKFRAGVYINDEFFGLFVIPLAGIDWKINDKDYLFGLLPGRLTYEHRWNDRLYGGFTFRALTNSYRLSDGQYLRLDDNQLSIFLDYYATKHMCITLEPGYGLVRKLRTGLNDKEYIIDEKLGDGPFVKLSAAYRIRL